MADASILECFPNPAGDRPYVIEHVAEEFTSVCPKTGHPDFGVVTVRYVPGDRCVELKSLKLYLHAYRNEGAFYEKVTNVIADDLISVMEPKWLEVRTDWRGRGGIRSTLRVEHGSRPTELR